MLNTIDNVPLVEFVYKRCQLSSKADFAAVITSDDATDDALYNYCIKRGINIFRGDLENVLARYIGAAEFYSSDIICRVCGDSPFVDVDLIDRMFQIIEDEGCDYVAPDKEQCIAGLDSEVFTSKALRKSADKATSRDEMEHVTLYIKNHNRDFKLRVIDAALGPDHLRNAVLTVDYPDDLRLCDRILGLLDDKYGFSSNDILRVLSENRQLLRINQNRGANSQERQ